MPFCFCCLLSCSSDRCFPAHRFVFAVSFAAAAFVFFTKASHTQWHVPVDVSKFESASSSSSFRIFVPLILVSLSPSACLSFCLPPPSLFLFSSFFCVSVQMWLLVVFPSSVRLLSHLTTAHSRCDEFLPTIFHLFFDFGFDVLVFAKLEGSALTCSYHKLDTNRHVF